MEYTIWLKSRLIIYGIGGEGGGEGGRGGGGGGGGRGGGGGGPLWAKALFSPRK